MGIAIVLFPIVITRERKKNSEKSTVVCICIPPAGVRLYHMCIVRMRERSFCSVPFQEYPFGGMVVFADEIYDQITFDGHEMTHVARPSPPHPETGTGHWKEKRSATPTDPR